MTTFLSGLVTVLIGGAVGAASIVGIVTSQTSAPAHSPARSGSIVVPYGSN